ncbi:hypothetical protein HY374_00105 [Candidatus Berkelbacteria bacterium]|nr:hypothetical protein [Candidatus Berkelbacteria bacterium]
MEKKKSGWIEFVGSDVLIVAAIGLILAAQVARSGEPAALFGGLALVLAVAVGVGGEMLRAVAAARREAERKAELARPATDDARWIAEARGRMGPIPIRYP